MNIIYIPGGPEASTAEGRPSQADMGEYIRRGTEINMACHKIVNCAPGNDDDDVVTFRGLSAYYRKGTALNMGQQQIKNLAPATEPNDALTLLQARTMLSPRTRIGIIRRNRYGAAILLKCNYVVPISLFVRSHERLFVQEPVSIVARWLPFTQPQNNAPFFALFITREPSFEGRSYCFQYYIRELDFVEYLPTDDECAELDPFALEVPRRDDPRLRSEESAVVLPLEPPRLSTK